MIFFQQCRCRRCLFFPVILLLLLFHLSLFRLCPGGCELGHRELDPLRPSGVEVGQEEDEVVQHVIVLGEPLFLSFSRATSRATSSASMRACKASSRFSSSRDAPHSGPTISADPRDGTDSSRWRADPGRTAMLGKRTGMTSVHPVGSREE
jgi:hypothetical protein